MTACNQNCCLIKAGKKCPSWFSADLYLKRNSSYTVRLIFIWKEVVITQSGGRGSMFPAPGDSDMLFARCPFYFCLTKTGMKRMHRLSHTHSEVSIADTTKKEKEEGASGQGNQLGERNKNTVLNADRRLFQETKADKRGDGRMLRLRGCRGTPPRCWGGKGEGEQAGSRCFGS